MLKIDLLRHGETRLSHTLRGSTDDELTELGWAQMQQTIERYLDLNSSALKWQVIFSSPLQRCHLFAAHLAQALSLELIVDVNLQEMHFGDWEGLSTQSIYEHEPELLANFWQRPTVFHPPNAEKLQDFHERIGSSMVHIQQKMQKNNWQHALVITHGGVIKLLKCLALQQPLDDILKMKVELATLNRFGLQKNASVHLLQDELA